MGDEHIQPVLGPADLLLVLHRETSLRLRIIRCPEKSSVKEILSIATPRAMEEFSSGVFLLLQRVIMMMVAGSAAVMMHTLAFLYLDLLMVIPSR